MWGYPALTFCVLRCATTTLPYTDARSGSGARSLEHVDALLLLRGRFGQFASVSK